MIYGNRDGTLVICRQRGVARLLAQLRQWLLLWGARSSCSCGC